MHNVKVTCATLLKTESGQDLLEFGMCAEFGQLDVHATAQAGTQVRWAGEDETKMIVPHETMVVLLEDILNLLYNIIKFTSLKWIYGYCKEKTAYVPSVGQYRTS